MYCTNGIKQVKNKRNPSLSLSYRAVNDIIFGGGSSSSIIRKVHRKGLVLFVHFLSKVTFVCHFFLSYTNLNSEGLQVIL